MQWIGVVLYSKLVYNAIRITTPRFHCTPPLMNLDSQTRGVSKGGAAVIRIVIIVILITIIIIIIIVTIVMLNNNDNNDNLGRCKCRRGKRDRKHNVLHTSNARVIHSRG